METLISTSPLLWGVCAYSSAAGKRRSAEDPGLLEFLTSTSVPILEALDLGWKIGDCKRISDVW